MQARPIDIACCIVRQSTNRKEIYFIFIYLIYLLFFIPPLKVRPNLHPTLQRRRSQLKRKEQAYHVEQCRQPREQLSVQAKDPDNDSERTQTMRETRINFHLNKFNY